MASTNEPSGSPQTASAKREPPQGTTLTVMDLEDEEQRQVLLAQRKICGWGENKITYWRNGQSKGHRTMFWIAIPKESVANVKTDSDTPLYRQKHTGDEMLCVGHISLDKVHSPRDEGFINDVKVTKDDGSELTITSLFVLPQFGNLRLGAFAMDRCEEMATQEPYGSTNCKAVNITAIAPRYYPGGSDTDIWAKLGAKAPQRDNNIWYRRRGYVSYMELPCYPAKSTDGKDMPLNALYLTKKLV